MRSIGQARRQGVAQCDQSTGGAATQVAHCQRVVAGLARIHRGGCHGLLYGQLGSRGFAYGAGRATAVGHSHRVVNRGDVVGDRVGHRDGVGLGHRGADVDRDHLVVGGAGCAGSLPCRPAFGAAGVAGVGRGGLAHRGAGRGVGGCRGDGVQQHITGLDAGAGCAAVDAGQGFDGGQGAGFAKVVIDAVNPQREINAGNAIRISNR